MGHLIMFAATGTLGAIPEWFQSKWEPFVGFAPELYCKHPNKWWGELEIDIQRIMQETWKEGLEPQLTLVYINECGNADRVDIRPEGIRYFEPSEWREVPTLRAHQAWDGCPRPSSSQMQIKRNGEIQPFGIAEE